MTSREDIRVFLEKAGIEHNDTVLIHSSLRSIGQLDGGADMLIDAFTGYLDDGLFIIPSHTWDNVTKQNPFFNVRKTMPCIGALPCAAVKRADGVRSLHPTHSVVAFGKRAESYVVGEENSATPAPSGGCWARLYDERAKILLIGVGHDKNTYIHAVDEMLGIPNRLSSETFTVIITDAHNNEFISPPFHTHYTKGLNCCCSEFYPNFKDAFEQSGAVTYSALGNAVVYICDAVRIKDTLSYLWGKADHDLCIRNETVII